MTEDFNDGPITIEDKQSIFSDKDNCSLCGNNIGLMECGDCGLRFCNELIDNKSHMLYHLKDSNHNSIKIITKDIYPYKFKEVKCCICKNNTIYDLYILLNKEKDNNYIDIKKAIFCKKHIPIDHLNEAQALVLGKENIKANDELIIHKDKKYKGNKNNELKYSDEKIHERQKLLKDVNDIVNRKYNKVKLIYENRYDYYEIYKPLIIADYIYTKKVYDNKITYDIELLVNKSEKYFFQIPDDFIEINFSPGRVLKFFEVDKYEYLYEDEIDDDYEPIQFVGVITNNLYNDYKQLYDIWIMPINRHITTLKNHEGKYKIKEEFCSIPYMRMLEALDLFQTDENDDEGDGAVSLNLVRRILGFDKNNENLKDFQESEEKTLKNLFVKEINSKLKTELENYGKLNESQISSMKNVFKNLLNLIQGPPGTGKTFLSSFIVYNIFKYRNDKSQKILLCSPSNSATDNLALSLLKLNQVIDNKMRILRVFAKSREYIHLEDELLNISLHKKLQIKFETDDISQIPKEEIQEEIDEMLKSYDIVIATCSTTWDDRISRQNFPFVIIDEVTQCCEIESLIPIVHGCKHLTLIGDQKQLGPIVLHPQADFTGMKVSLLERMLKLYPELLNVLNLQYRMHEEIIKFPSKEFYNSEIKNALPKESRINKSFNSKFNWPNKDIPLIFVHVVGHEIVIKSGKSKQNKEEAQIVALFVEKMNKSGINLRNIGVITPYSAQKILIHKMLREKYKANNLIENLKISSVDGFQGREKDFIIISNVRSNPKNIIGFLKDFRRLNVSITRAKYGMIIIGNAECLYKGSNIWAKLISYYKLNKILAKPKIIDSEEELEYGIDEFVEEDIEEDNLVDVCIDYSSYDFDASGNEPNINEDLLNNFECSENVYAEGNKKYYKKKKEKKNKNKKKKYKYNDNYYE